MALSEEVSLACLRRMQAMLYFFKSMSVFFVNMSELKPAGHTAELKHVVRY
jgi:hypothetical protein